MKKSILAFTLILIASTQVVGQVKITPKAVPSIEKQMTLNAANELRLASESLKNSMITGVLGAALLTASTQVEFGRDGFYLIGGVCAIASIVQIINVPIHLKRSSAYFTASANGVKITF